MEVVQNLRVRDFSPPLTADTRGSSLGNPAAGFGSSNTKIAPLSIQTKDKVGAALITAIVGVAIIGSTAYFLLYTGRIAGTFACYLRRIMLFF